MVFLHLTEILIGPLIEKQEGLLILVRLSVELNTWKTKVDFSFFWQDVIDIRAISSFIVELIIWITYQFSTSTPLPSFNENCL